MSVWARDASSSGTHGEFDANAWTGFTLSAVPCTSAGLSASTASPVVAGPVITFTGSAVGCPNARYEFWLRPATASGTWRMVQGYSGAGTFSWSTSGLAGGFYLSVWIKDASSLTASFDRNATMLYTVEAASCASVTMSASASGSHVIFSAAAAGCSNPGPLYESWILRG